MGTHELLEQMHEIQPMAYQLEEGEWVAVFKKEEKIELKNYRPITVLTTIDKVFEKLIRKQITSFLEPNLSINIWRLPAKPKLRNNNSETCGSLEMGDW